MIISGGRYNFNFVGIKILKGEKILYFNSTYESGGRESLRYYIWWNISRDVLKEVVSTCKKETLLCDKIDLRVIPNYNNSRSLRT